ncbi:MAG TPA: hypothetical protein VJZ00_04280 [Thermoanaerobaculia bacterium]|nr:hypothetical protein [Thermoanaerobaculia bacterium]
MEPLLLGYMAKRITPRPAGFPAPVDEICSVSGCIAQEPEGWIDEWKHNDFFLYDSAQLAESVVPKRHRDRFRVYAYRAAPIYYDPDGGRHLFELPEIHPEPIPSSFEFLGYDVVSRGESVTFECSPLSCSTLATEIHVNQRCLLDSYVEALEVAKRCAEEQPEPGNYFIVEVWASTAPSNSP